MRTSTVLNDDKVDAQIVSQSEIERTWEELLVSGPIIVNYVGNLIVLSSKQDFPFTPPTPDYIYQHIIYPNSFRTTLVQITNQIYNVFIDAHNKMDKIQLNIQQIPNHLTTILKLLTSASPRLIQSMLPIALSNIERIANQCADLANSTMKNYDSVTALLQEVTLATIATYGYNTGELDNINGLIKNSTEEQNLLNSQLEIIRNRYKEARETLEKAREDYYNAFHAIPTKPKRFIGFVTAGIVGGIIGGSLACIFTCNKHPSAPVIDNTAFQNAKEKAELALKLLQQAEAAYDERYYEMLEKQNKLASIIMQMSQLNMNQTDYKTTINILVSATKEMTGIQQQWTNMTKFFSSLAIRAEATRETVLYKFINTIKDVALANEPLDAADREFFVTEMLQVADDIDRDAHLLYIMAKTYYDVSSQYMINQISRMPGLAVTQTDSEREIHLKQLGQDTLLTSAKVSRMALERKQQYEQRNRARQNDYKRFIQQLISEELEVSIGR